MVLNNRFESLIPGYHITEQLQEGVVTLLYRGYRHHDRLPVLLQVLRPAYLHSQYIERFKQQAELGQRLRLRGLVQTLDTVMQGSLAVIVFEDNGAELWQQQLHRPAAASAVESATAALPCTIERLLEIGLALANALAELHALQLVHQHVQPQHVLIQPQTGQVQLLLAPPIDLVNSQYLTQATSLDSILTAMAYAAPEQTGRMNNVAVDYRSDFYSLGITLYQAAIGQLPFPQQDLNELIHSHIARPIPSLCAQRPDLPVSLEQIIHKLVAKTPNDRYQSAFGLKSDLGLCLESYQNHQDLPDFIAGATDLGSELAIPQQLYDRRQELQQLHTAYQQVRQGHTRTVLINGESGVGKSLLVKEFQSQLGQYPSYFIRGNCDAVRREVPYLALAQAFQSLFCQLLMEPETAIQQWRHCILQALGDNAYLLCEAIPDLVQIIGPQEKGPKTESRETENRLKLAFQSLISVIAQPAQPVVLFIDDLQWLDAASTKLLEHLLLSHQTPALLLICACRLDASYNTQEMGLRLIRNLVVGPGRQEITLAPFSLVQMEQLVADVLHTQPAAIVELSTLIFHRTQGNPFFAHQLLEFLYHEQLLVFNFSEGYWKWDLEQIRHFGVTENVVELMEQKVLKLPIATRKLLQLAACIGLAFDTGILTALCPIAPAAIPQALALAVQEGMLLPIASADPSSYSSMLSAPSPMVAHFQFLHERVRQAIYDLMPLPERQQWHWQIGQRWLVNMVQQRQEDRLFDVVHQLNLGKDLIQDAIARQELAHLNLKAARRAKPAAAYQSALQYVQSGVTLLPPESWTTDYQLARDLWLEQAECHYLTGNYAEAERAFETLNAHVKTVAELADVYAVQMVCYLNQNRYEEAQAVGQMGLIKLGVALPETLTEAAVLAAFNTLSQEILNHSPAYFLALPTCTDRTMQQILRLLQYFAAATISQDQSRYRWAIVEMVRRSIQYGNTERSAYAYIAYGTILSSGFGEYERGHQLGQVALELSQLFQAMQGLTHFSYGGLLAHWRVPFAECQQHLQVAFQHCQQMGELLYALYAQVLKIDVALLAGNFLDATQAEIQLLGQFAAQRQHRTMQLDAMVKLQFIRNLQGLTQDAASFSSIEVAEASIQQQLHDPQTPNPTRSRYYIYKTQSLYLFGYYPMALETAQASAELVNAHFGPAVVIDHYFFYGLTVAALYDQADAADQERYHAILVDCLQRLQRWHYHCPTNFGARWHVLAGELDRINGDDPTCHYDEAIGLAQVQNMLQICAIANELAGEYYWGQQHQRIARAYLHDACVAYQRWGAIAKTNALQQQYRSLLTWRGSFMDSANCLALPNDRILPQRLPSLDWMTVLKASQALSSEIVYSSLLEKLLTILMESAGAERGSLLIRHPDHWLIEAEGSVEQAAIVCTLKQTPLTPEALPLNLITYVERTRETILLNAASEDLRFAADTYIHAHKLKSVLCFPIIYQGKQTGILYLENRLVAGAFTPAQLEVVRLLTAQVSISVENAQLYQNMQQHLTEVEAKNQELQRSQQQLQHKTDELEAALQDLKQTQAQLVQTEKMSGLGQLVAGVAHEVKNPLNFIQGNLDYANQYIEQLFSLLDRYQALCPEPPTDLQTYLETIDLDYVREDLPKLLSSMTLGSDRIQTIVSSLRDFSRTDGDTKEFANIQSGIEGTLMILRSRLGANRDRPAINLVSEFGELPPVLCYPSQLNQVVMNLIANAIDAIDETAASCDFESNRNHPGEIIVTTLLADAETIAIRIQDNGPGMDDATRQKIFEAFFTTKPKGAGTGLGLSISHQIIVEKHQGQLLCESTPGEGTSFTIVMPIASEATPEPKIDETQLDFIDGAWLSE